jgi:ferritin-like metal-binding protein YciE
MSFYHTLREGLHLPSGITSLLEEGESVGPVHNFSELLGEKEAAGLLAETLQEEKAADKQLTALAKSIDVEAKV